LPILFFIAYSPRLYSAAPPEPPPEPPSGPTLHLPATPHVQHLAANRVVITWQTERPEAAVLAYARPGAAAKVAGDLTPKTSHSVVLSELKPGVEYRFHVIVREPDGTARISEVYAFDASCDLAPMEAREIPSPFPNDARSGPIAAEAGRIVRRTGVRRGYCLVLGCPSGQLAWELARLTDLQIVCVEPDAARVDVVRRRLDEAGVYGVRVTVHRSPLDRLPYTDGFANLIVSERTLFTGELPTPAAEVCRVLRPCGGVAWLGRPQTDGRLARAALDAWLKPSPQKPWQIETRGGLWAVLRRGPVEGAGQWSHLYADAGNSACSNDRLSGPVDLQWFGRPGPRTMIDRHNRAMAPLVVNGRLVVVGNDRIKAVDAYNGTPLWDLTIPHSRRTLVNRDCAQAALADDKLYLAVDDTCRAIDAATGRWIDTLTVPAAESAENEKTAGVDTAEPLHWGYVGYIGNRLIGSARRPAAAHNALTFNSWAPGYGDHRPIVTSRRLFCFDRQSGGVLWTSADHGVILNPTIALDADRAYFIASRAAAAVADDDGRTGLKTCLTKGATSLIALDQQTGAVAWQHEIDLSKVEHMVYLLHSDGVLVIASSRNQSNHPSYDLAAFEAATGRPTWTTDHIVFDKRTGGDHGEQEQHPAIIGRVVYSQPLAFDLKTGADVEFKLDRAGGGCGVLSGSATCLFGRGAQPRMYPIADGGRKNVPLTTVTRPGCWINIVPAGGLLLIPEGSSGCSCPYSVQASIALGPKQVEPAPSQEP